MNYKKNILKCLIGLTIVLILLFKVDVNELLKTLSRINILFLFVSLVHVSFQLILSSYNIKIMLDALNYHLRYKKIFRIYNQAWSVGKFIPGGRLSVAYFLRKKGIPTGDAVFITFFNELITLASLTIISVLGTYLLIPLMDYLFLNILLISLILVLVLCISLKGVRTIIKKIFLRRYTSKFKGFSRKFNLVIAKRKKAMALNLFFTFTQSLMGAIFVMILFKTLDTPVSFLYVLVINTLLVVISLIPITIAGLGTKEVAAVYLYSLIGIDAPVILAVYIMLRAIIIVIAAISLITSKVRKL